MKVLEAKQVTEKGNIRKVSTQRRCLADKNRCFLWWFGTGCKCVSTVLSMGLNGTAKKEKKLRFLHDCSQCLWTYHE